MTDAQQILANQTESVDPDSDRTDANVNPPAEHNVSPAQKEIGGRDGPDPTRYGDWEKAGRCIDF
jgi:hypothetical protein